MTWAIGTKLTIFSIGLMMIFAVIPPSYADGTIVIEDSIDNFGDINPILLAVNGVDEFSVLTISYDCGNSSDSSKNLDPTLQVFDPDGTERFNDDSGAFPGCGAGFFGSMLVYSGAGLKDGVYTINPTSYCAFFGDLIFFGCPGVAIGPYTLTITLTGAGQIGTEFGVAPPTDPPNDAPKGQKDLLLTPNGPCDALQNTGSDRGRDIAKERNCGVVAEDDTQDFIDIITFVNVLDNDLNRLTGDSTGLTVTAFAEVSNTLPGIYTLSPDGTFGILCNPGVGTLTLTYTATNLFGLSDTATVTATCID